MVQLENEIGTRIKENRLAEERAAQLRTKRKENELGVGYESMLSVKSSFLFFLLCRTNMLSSVVMCCCYTGIVYIVTSMHAH